MIEIDPEKPITFWRLILPFEKRLLYLSRVLEKRGRTQTRARQVSFRKVRMELLPYPPKGAAVIYQALLNTE